LLIAGVSCVEVEVDPWMFLHRRLAGIEGEMGALSGAWYEDDEVVAFSNRPLGHIVEGGGPEGNGAPEFVDTHDDGSNLEHFPILPRGGRLLVTGSSFWDAYSTN
jgi:hypothetical protein